MKHLENLNNIECATLVMETVPAVMRALRTEMRSQRPADLSVLQFRALTLIKRQPGVSMSGLTEHTGLTMATVSKMVDGLVERGLVLREAAPSDRRRVLLALTEAGRATVDASHHVTELYLSRVLEPLDEPARQTVAEAMRLLQPLFATGADKFEEQNHNDNGRTDHSGK